MKFTPAIPVLNSPLTRVAQVAACILILSSAHASQSAKTFSPISLTLQPKAIQLPLPIWATDKPIIQPESDTVLVPVPALASQDEIGCFSLTVVFTDDGDGGPVVEWQPKEGETILLSAGLGETGLALGLNARTLLITQSLALDGGTIRISYAGRFSKLISVTLRPARELSIAALGAEFNPSLLGENEEVLTSDEVSGADEIPQSGDRTEGQLIHAELSATPKQLDAAGFEGGTEFIIPLSAKPHGCLLQTEIAGLDPASQIEVTVNSQALGALGSAPFSLNSPSTLLSPSGRLQIAGWHTASLFIPASLLTEGDNSIVLTLQRAAGDEGKSVFLRKARVDLLYSLTPAPVPTPTPPSTPSSGTTNAASFQASTPAAVTSASPSPVPTETLSTGSQYGNPSPSLFHAALPAVLSTQSSQ